MKNSTTTRRGFVAGLGLAGIAGTALAGCSSPDMDKAKSGGKGGSSITLYTSEPEDKINEIISAFNEDEPDIEVKLYRAGTGEIDAKIASESGAGGVHADVLLAADRPTYERYKSQKLLAKLDFDGADDLLDGFVDPDGYYVGTRVIPTVIAKNTSSDLPDPKGWQDLTESDYSGKIALPSPDVSGAAAYNAAVWLQQKSLGEKWLRALIKNKPTVLESNGPVSQAVAEGSSPIGVVVDYLIRDLKAKGSPIDAIYPEEGMPFVDEPAAVFEDSKNKDAAQKFVSFLVSQKAQELASKQNYIPVRKGVATPKGSPDLEDLKLFEADPAEIAKKQPAAVKLFDKLVDGN